MFFKPPHFSPKRLSTLPEILTPDLEETLALVDLDHLALQAEFKALQHHASALQKYATRIRHLLSAMGKVPPEILTEIFRIFCADHSLERRDSLPPIILVSVCKKWRKIVVDDPRCWTTIPIVGRIRRESNKVSLTRQFIQRATLVTGADRAVLPLTIIIDCENISYEAMDILINHSANWKSVRLIGFSSYFENRQSPELPLLQSLEFSGRASKFFSNFFRKAHALRHLSQPGDPRLFPEARSSFRRQWPGLTSLQLNQSAPDTILATLQLCTSLESLTLVDISRYGKIASLSDSPVKLEKLRTLSIILGRALPTDVGLLSLVLSRMQVPELIVLKIEFCPVVKSCFGSIGPVNQSWNVQPLFENSDLKLKELHLNGVDIADTDLIDLLRRRLPTLVSLTVIEAEDGFRSYGSQAQTLTTSFLSALNARNGLVPQLRHIAFERSSQLQFDRRSFVQMVCSRTPCECAGAGARDSDDGSTTFTSGNVAFLRSVSLRIKVRAADTVDPMTVGVYRDLRTRLGVVIINDDDPRQLREREPKLSPFSRTDDTFSFGAPASTPRLAFPFGAPSSSSAPTTAQPPSTPFYRPFFFDNS